jgi:hypothetical protein
VQIAEKRQQVVHLPPSKTVVLGQLPGIAPRPELSATSGRRASGSAGSVCKVNTFWPSLGPVAIR